MTDLTWNNSLLEFFDELFVFFSIFVAELTIFSNLESIAPEDDLQVRYSLGPLSTLA